MRQPRRRPTDAELELLRILWSRGPSTVREVAAALGREQAYTTVLKLLQIMTEKGLVNRDETVRSHVYAAAAPADRTEQQMVGDLLDRLFDGSASRLMLRALEARTLSEDELDQLRALLDQRRGGRDDDRG